MNDKIIYKPMKLFAAKPADHLYISILHPDTNHMKLRDELYIKKKIKQY